MPSLYSQNQANYWNLFYDLSVYFHYLQIYQERDQKTIRYIGIFLAVTSSGSIAAWAIWQHISWLWAVIIASSQVLGVISSFLPFKQREKTLRMVLPQMNALLLDCEDMYDMVSKGELTDEEIHEETMRLKRRWGGVKNDMYDCGLPNRKSFMDEAQRRAKQAMAQYND